MTSQQPSEPRFPFTAIVGQTAMKRALLLNAVNPKIGGVLIRGKKGTAKSTAVRSLAALLPEVDVLQGCPYSCAPGARQGLCQWCQSGSNDNPAVTRQVRIVELPVGATEDRLVGSLDIEQAIKTGNRSFEPGLIAATHRGILYIDEVNLLNDHLVDVLLDAAAMGRNYVEREGVSVSHAADFILVGTMNPEEGDLRPQLLDRFGLAVEVEGALPAEERREVVLRRIAYEADPFRFMAEWREEEERERARLLRSRERLAQVEAGGDILELITDICAEYQVDGLRGDIVMYKTAGTIAAYEGRSGVTAEDVREAARLALLHRQRRQPFQQPNLVTEQLDTMIQEFQLQQRQREPADSQADASQDQDDGDSDPSDLESPDSTSPEEPGSEGPANQEQLFEVGSPFSVRSLEVQPPDERARLSAGRRSKTVSGTSAGRYVGARVPQGAVTDLALDATLRTAAPHQKRRREDQPSPPGVSPSLSPREGGTKGGPGPLQAGPALLLEPWDVREKVRETKTGSLILFVVDASGSMGAQRRMVAVKGAVLSLLLDAYQRRDRVGLIAFRGTSAELLLPPTNSVELAQTHLAEMPTGGRTPLSRGLHLALQVIEAEKMKDRAALPLVVLLSDGRANVTLAHRTGPAAVGEGNPTATEAKEVASLFKENRITSVVIDTEDGFIKMGLARPIAEAMGARCLRLDELRAEGLAQAVRLQLPTAGPPDPAPEEEPGSGS
ncbi:MAG: magnesium chelatase subunit D family protein [Dehalococcoidia bacterium]|nr:magnesium chelatase subunit D family protein [Dehalococcoidia bacterium]